MREIMYDQSSVAIAAILLVSMALCIEAGYRAGRGGTGLGDSTKAHVQAIQAALLGLLALLIGFTFSLSLQRYDSRSAAVTEEANAIGTAYLRTDLLPASVRDEVRAQLRAYLALRVQAGSVTLVTSEQREALGAAAEGRLDALWRLAVQAAAEDSRQVVSGLFIEALNEMIDSYGRRDAALHRHVPEIVLFLLYGTFLMTGMIVGYAAGMGGHRASFVTYVMVALVVVMVFIIIDLDRPRRGLIQVSQRSLVGLKTSIDARPALPVVAPVGVRPAHEER